MESIREHISAGGIGGRKKRVCKQPASENRCASIGTRLAHWGDKEKSMMQTSWKTDSEIQQDVLAELNWDSRVKGTEVGVAVDGATVTLTGTVNSWGKKIAAQEAAHRVACVLDVANDIQVRAVDHAEKTDTEIAKAVRHALEWDVFVKDELIRSTVSNGVVTLQGEVETLGQWDITDRAVRNLHGVRGVTNLTTVKP